MKIELELIDNHAFKNSYHAAMYACAANNRSLSHIIISVDLFYKLAKYIHLYGPKGMDKQAHYEGIPIIRSHDLNDPSK